MELKALLKLSWLPLVVGLAACAGNGAGPLDSTPLPPGSGANGMGGQSASELAGRWRLVRLVKAGQAPVELAPSDRFTAEFVDGRALLAADCNRCTGSFTAGPNTLTVGPMACTRAYCASAPLDTDFALLVGGAERWLVAAGELTLLAPNGLMLLRR